mgnify:CR=1 FL=1
MNKFKVGQKVKIIRTGKEGEITFVDGVDFSEYGWTNCCYKVTLKDEDYYWFTVHDLELIKETLDEKEKEYLNNVIKPFRDKVTFIQKNSSSFGDFIKIGIKNDIDINLPFFERGTMYKGMQVDKKYILTELRLEDRYGLL